MTMMQKLNLAALGAGAVSAAWYVYALVAQMVDAPLASVAWKWPMGISLIVFLGLLLVAGIALAVTDKRIRETDGAIDDERDRHAERKGDAWAGHCVQAAVGVAIILAWFDQPSFWIANTLYAGIWIGGGIGLVVRQMAYRGGAA